MDNTFADMNKKLEERYKKAKEALEVVKSFFGDLGESTNGTVTNPKKSKKSKNTKDVPLILRARKGSMREKVFAVIVKSWATLDDLVEATKIDRDKIRGVVNAPDVKEMIETKMEGEKKFFRVKQTEAN